MMLANLTPTRARLCPADRDRYGDAPKADDGWVTFDIEALAELPASELQEIETATGFRVAFFWVPSQRISAHGQRAAMWIARRLAGAVDSWADFDPRIFLAEVEVIKKPAAVDEGDAVPPQSGSVTGSPAAP